MSEIDVNELKIFFKKYMCNHCKDTLDFDCEQCQRYTVYLKAKKFIEQLQQLKTENESLKQQLCNKTLEIEGIKQIIHNTLEDFSIEYGTKAYDTLLTKASKYIDVSDFE